MALKVNNSAPVAFVERNYYPEDKNAMDEKFFKSSNASLDQQNKFWQGRHNNISTFYKYGWKTGALGPLIILAAQDALSGGAVGTGPVVPALYTGLVLGTGMLTLRVLENIRNRKWNKSYDEAKGLITKAQFKMVDEENYDPRRNSLDNIGDIYTSVDSALKLANKKTDKRLAMNKWNPVALLEKIPPLKSIIELFSGNAGLVDNKDKVMAAKDKSMIYKQERFKN
jgi:hypothetical protein